MLEIVSDISDKEEEGNGILENSSADKNIFRKNLLESLFLSLRSVDSKGYFMRIKKQFLTGKMYQLLWKNII